MLKAIGWILKAALFSILILILGQVIHWGGKPISDHFKSGVATVERTVAGVPVTRQVVDWTKTTVGSKAERKPSHDGFTPSEREKLRNLIRELNNEKRPGK